MGMKAVLAILLMHAWMKVVLTAGVPSKFLGLWEGATPSDDGRSWKVTVAIIGGPFDSTIASMHLVSSRDTCIHHIKLATEDSKNGPNENENTFKGRTERVSDNDSSFPQCWLGEFKFEAVRLERTLVDIVWRQETGGKVVEEWSFILERVDAGRTAKAMDTCETKPLSPSARLRAKLNCDESKEKGKKRGF